MTEAAESGAWQGKAPHPAIFLVMYLPFGIASGYFSVTLGYLLAHAGVSTAAIAVLVATLTWLQVFKIVWAPLVDTVLTYRGLYALACITLVASLAGTGLVPASPASMPLLSALAILMGAAIGLIGVTTNGLMARISPPGQRGRAGGWSMAGNLGGTGLGGGLGLWIATHSTVHWLSAVVLAALSACALAALRFVPEPDHPHRGATFPVTLRNLLTEIWAMIRARPGALALLIMALPMGTGSASNLFSAIAGDWGASGNLVALVTGVLSGVVAALGCLAGGYMCDVIDRKGGYMLAGMLMVACTLTMVVAPKTPAIFAVLTLAYAMIGGIAYGACYAVVLDASSSRAAASKCDVLISLSNLPIAAMTVIDGAAQTRFGTNGMLLTESAAGVAAVVLYLGVAVLTRRHAPDMRLVEPGVVSDYS
jgi:PAT family beta-lactamase induction signal transducer AmpG